MPRKAQTSPSQNAGSADTSPSLRSSVDVRYASASGSSPTFRYFTRSSSKIETIPQSNAANQNLPPIPPSSESKSPYFTRSSAKPSSTHHVAQQPITSPKKSLVRPIASPEPSAPSVRPNSRHGIKRRLSQPVDLCECESDSEDSHKMDVSDSPPSHRSSASSSTSHTTTRDDPDLRASSSSFGIGISPVAGEERSAGASRGVFGLPEAPVFYPTAEEFADPNMFLERIQPLVEPFGICRIVPPKEWKREAWRLQVDPRTFTFNTKTQSVHSLQVRYGPYCRFLVRLQYYWTHVVGQTLTKLPELDGLPVDLYQLHCLVQQLGGYDKVKEDDSWETLFKPLHLNSHATCAPTLLAAVYRKYLLPFDLYLSDGGHIPEVTYCTSTGAPAATTTGNTSSISTSSTSTASPVPGHPKAMHETTRKGSTSKTPASRQAKPSTATATVTPDRHHPPPPTQSHHSPYVTRSSSNSTKRFKMSDESSIAESTEEESVEQLAASPAQQGPRQHAFVAEVVPGFAARTLERIAAHPKTTNYGPYGDIAHEATEKETGMWRTVRAHSFSPDQDVSFIRCFYCRKGDMASSLVLCDTPGCAGSAHLRCMKPARTRLPSGRYYCPYCCGEERPTTSSSDDYVSPIHHQRSTPQPLLQTDDGSNIQDLDLTESLGFGHGFGKRYTLAEFNEMAMKFATFWFSKETLPDSERDFAKSSGKLEDDQPSSSSSSDATYIPSPVRITRASSAMRSGAKLATTPMVVSADEIEREYWKLVSEGDHLVSVQYGSDVDVSSAGASSGFPLDVQGRTVGNACPEMERWHSVPKRPPGSSFSKQDVNYLRDHGWNLNSLPYVTSLKYLGESVSGVTRPMLYIGMLFSSFCWHTEDNWLYSINYIHSGAPKRWYGVSGADAPDFENALRSELPHLFSTEPQLLYQLTTTLHPDILKKHGVRMCTTLQQEGEFVLTFPRAYHSGLNCGFNFAESVNFASHSWLDWGLMAVNEYRFVRSSVFSHEKMIWQIATSAATLSSLSLARSVRRQLELYMKYAKATIKRLQAHGIEETFQFTKSHLALLVDDRDRPLGVKEVPDAPTHVSRRTHVNLMDKDGFEPEDPQCYVCGYDLFFHRVDCVCKTPRLPRCLNHALQPICKCPEEQKFVSFRFRNSSMKAVIKLLDAVIEKLSGEKSRRTSWAGRSTQKEEEEDEEESDQHQDDDELLVDLVEDNDDDNDEEEERVHDKRSSEQRRRRKRSQSASY